MAKTSAEYQRAYRERQKQRMAADPEYAEEVRTKDRASSKKQREKRNSTPEGRAKFNAYMREWHAKQIAENPDYAERKLKSSRKWREANPELQAEYVRKWASKTDRSEYNLAWSRANRDKRYAARHRRIAFLRGDIDVENLTKQEIWDRDSEVCGICELIVDDIQDYELDHIIPLSRGGHHTYENVQVSHRWCNRSKKDKLQSEYIVIKEVDEYGMPRCRTLSTVYY